MTLDDLRGEIAAAGERQAALQAELGEASIDLANAAVAGTGWPEAQARRDRLRAEMEQVEARLQGLERRLEEAQEAAALEASRELRRQRAAALEALGAQETVTRAALDAFECELAELGRIYAVATDLRAPAPDAARALRERLDDISARLRNRGLAA